MNRSAVATRTGQTEILAAIAQEAVRTGVILNSVHVTGHRAEVHVPEAQDSIALRDALFHTHGSDPNTGWVIGQWELVDLLEPERPSTRISVTIVVAS